MSAMRSLLLILTLLSPVLAAVSPAPSPTTVTAAESQLLERLRGLPPEQAEKELQTALTPSSSPALRYTAAQLACRLGDYSLAETRLRRLLADHPDFPHARLLLAQTLATLRRHQEAAALLRELLGRAHDDEPRHTLWALLAQSLLELGQPLPAETAIRNAIALAPEPQDAYLRLLLRALLDQRRGEEAAALARQLLRDAPTDTTLWLIAIQRELDLSHHDRAAALAELAIRAGNRDPQLTRLRERLLQTPPTQTHTPIP